MLAILSRNFTRLIGLETQEYDNTDNVERIIVNPTEAEDRLPYPSPWQRNLYLTNDNIDYEQ